MQSHSTTDVGRVAFGNLIERTQMIVSINRGHGIDGRSNPLVNIGNTKTINAVVVGGKLVDRVSIEEMLAKVENANKN